MMIQSRLNTQAASITADEKLLLRCRRQLEQAGSTRLRRPLAGRRTAEGGDGPARSRAGAESPRLHYASFVD